MNFFLLRFLRFLGVKIYPLFAEILGLKRSFAPPFWDVQDDTVEDEVVFGLVIGGEGSGLGTFDFLGMVVFMSTSIRLFGQ